MGMVLMKKVLTLLFAMFLVAGLASAQTFTVIHNFSGPDGLYPEAGLTKGVSGDLYGTTQAGGSSSGGTVFKLTRKGKSWVFSTLYSFQGGEDGYAPQSALIRGPKDTFYGVTSCGGNVNAGSGGPGCGSPGWGTIFSLNPPIPWTETAIYQLPVGTSLAPHISDGLYYGSNFISADESGNVYGLAFNQGIYGYGSVFKLSPGVGGWTYTSLHDFTGGSDGAYPFGRVVVHADGNLYGTTMVGGAYRVGVVWEITQ
jgi:uncharacterized repeat protein (TIGR03803 family)